VPARRLDGPAGEMSELIHWDVIEAGAVACVAPTIRLGI